MAFALVTLLPILGLVRPGAVRLALVLDVVLLLAFFLDARWAARTRLVARRRWPAMLVQGGASEVEVTVASESARPVGVVLREGLDASLAEHPLRHAFDLPAGGEERWSYTLVPRRRGEPTVAPLTGRVLGPLRLAWQQREMLGEERVRIYPQVRWKGRVGHLLALAQRRQLGTMPLAWQGVGTEPYALREYLPGDPPSKIHWKATARHGRLVTREDTWERGAKLVILLDAARTMAAWEGDRSKLDWALAGALALTRVAAGRGDHVTLVAFSDRVDRVVRVRSGSRGVATAYGRLFDLEARLAEPAYDLAAEKALELESRSATVVLFTSVVDLGAAELLRGALLALERRHRPLLVNLRDPQLERLATEAPRDEVEVFAQVSALEILLENRRLGRRLGRAGVRVVSTPADRLALETLDAYLALFRARLARRRTPAA